MKTFTILSGSIALFSVLSLAAPDMSVRDFFGNRVLAERQDCFTCTDAGCGVASDCLNFGCATACSCDDGVCQGTI